MNSGSPNAFANAREEIQLWPAAVMAFYFTVHETRLSLGLFVFLIWAGATSYKLHQHIREKIETVKGFHELRNEKSRGQSGKSNSTLAGYGEAFTQAGVQIWDEAKPSNPLLQFVTILSIGLNLVVGLFLFGWLLLRILNTPEPPLTALGLLSLPLLMVASIGAALAWNS